MSTGRSSDQAKTDAYAFGLSFVVHALLLVLLSMTNIAAQREVPIGYIEVDFGPLAEGQPVQQTEETQTEVEPDVPDPVAEEQPPVNAAAPEIARPVELPQQQPITDPDVVEKAPETEIVSPEQTTTTDDANDQDPQPEVIERIKSGTGASGGDTGAATGDDGAGSEPEAAAPFQIEGLNRTPVTAPPPPYSEKVNATIRVRITVDPQGRVVRQIPLLKGNPSLEQAVLETLRNWRFNPLPPNAPQENQVGIVTFRFRLE